MKFRGKHSSSYIETAVFEDYEFDARDVLRHGKNMLARNCVIKAECLVWYSGNITFAHRNIKNPLVSLITVPGTGEIIRDIEGADGIIEKADPEN